MTTSVQTNHAEVPVPVREPTRSRPSLPGSNGWTPANDDHTPLAAAWRAAHALNEVAEVRQDVAATRQEAAALRASVDKLDATLKKVDGAIRSFFKWSFGIVTVLFTAALLGAGGIAWRYFSTFHR